MATQDEKKKVWCRGDVCLAQWPGDSQFYPAVIKRFSVDKEGNKKALVTFSGYSSDNDELVDVNSLKVPASPRKPLTPKAYETASRKMMSSGITVDTDTDDDREKDIGMFSPLRGDEEQQRLREKFQELDREDQLTSEPGKLKTCRRRLLDEISSAPALGLHRKKQQCIATGPVLPRVNETVTSGIPSLSTGQRNVKRLDIIGSDSDTQSEHTEDSKDASFVSSGSGFADEDMEKPKFSHVIPLIKKRPYLLSPEGEQPLVQIPAPINQYLRDYQRAGVSFLYDHYRQGQGCLLGDDMGLGKTVQVIAFIAAVLGKTGTRHDVTQMVPRFIRMLDGDADDMSGDDVDQRKVFLIIGPASILFNWLSELDTWGYFGVGKYHGKYKAETIASLKRHKLDVVVTTFETCRDNIEEINSFEWDGIFADEAHKIKGLKAEVSKALRTLKCRHRYALTGTPLQNSVEELWCILDWTNPGCLGTLGDFQERFVRVIERGQKQDGTKRELAEARRAQEGLCRLRSHWMLRRTKSIIAEELPKKRFVFVCTDELVVFCRPSQLQLDIYQAILNRTDVQFIMQQNYQCDCSSGRRRVKCCHKKMPDGLRVKNVTMTVMSLLLKTANHLALLLPEFTNTRTQSEYNLAVCSELFASHPQFGQHSRVTSVSELSQPQFSGKMKVLQGLLSVFKKERSKVLIFSYSIRLLDIIERYVISARHIYRRLDGSTGQRQRAEVVTEFNRDQNIFLFLISTKAGGVGLNLTGANKVVIFDPNWNPTHDLQATDRAYRIGQRRDVHVLRLITTGTIEENIYLRQVYKQQLGSIATTSENTRRYFHAIAGDRDQQGELFGIENTFQLRRAERSVTEDIFQRNEEIEEGLRTFNVQKYVPRQDSSDSSGMSDTDLLDHESRNDTARESSGSDMALDDVKPTSRHRHHSNPRYVDNSSTYSDSSETESDTGVKDKHHNLHGNYKRVLDDSVHDTSPQPSTSHCADTKKHTALRKHTDERHVKGRGNLGKDKKVSWGEEETAEVQLMANFTSISDVLQNCGVAHTHCNRELIGGSKAEDHMTRCAMEDVFELHKGSQMPAMDCDPYIESSPESEDLGARSAEMGRATRKGRKRKSKDKEELLGKAVKTIGMDRVLIGQTPRALCRCHLESMAASMNISDPVKLAQKILVSTSEERLAMLRAFYVGQNAALDSLFTQPEKVRVSVTPAPKQKVLRARRQNAPTQRCGKSGQNTPSKSKQKQVSRKGYDFSSSDETEASEMEEEIYKKKLAQGKAKLARPLTATIAVGSGLESNQSGQDESIVTTNTDSIENLLDDVFGLNPVHDNSNKTVHKVDRSKRSRLSQDAVLNKRRSKNVMKPSVSAIIGKDSRNRRKTSTTRHMKASTSKTPILNNPTKTVSEAKEQTKAADKSVTAMLDDIFFGDGDTLTKTKKAPKYKSPRRVLRVDRDPTCAATSDFRTSATLKTSDDKASLKCDSDRSDASEIFSDPQKWIQKNKPHGCVDSETQDDACSDNEDIYDKL